MGVGAFIGPDGPMAPFKNPFEKELIPGRVVHVQDEDATYWDYATGWYGDHVDQAVVDAMMEAGLLALTHTDTVAKAWSRLIPGYVTGETLAIKVNLNNYDGTEPDPDINALIEPVNSVICGLLQFGFQPEDIVVYDVTHAAHNGKMPQTTFIDRCLFPGVRFECWKGNPAPFSTEVVQFDTPPGKPTIEDLPIANALANSDYLINMPIVKAHMLAQVTLSFKNHMGSVDRCDYFHIYLPAGGHYQPDYSPMIDIYKNPHFGAKTVLTVGDALFGNWKNLFGAPPRWLTFGDGAPNSLILSADAVAADSVMADLIDIERQEQPGFNPLNARAREYLEIARKERMGIFEQGDPWKRPRGSGYRRIDYIHLNGV
jgi:hypothetical protein